MVRSIPTIPAFALLIGLVPTAPRAQTPAARPQQTGTLSIDVGKAGAKVAVDGKPIGVTPLPGPWTLAAGRHTVEVNAGGGAPPQRKTVQVKAGELTVLKVAVQAPKPPPPPPVEPPPPPPRIVQTGAGFDLATAGYVSAGVGLAALGAGIFFGLDASGKSDDARSFDRRDPGHHRADLNALIADADRSAFLSNLSFGVAGVGLATGAALLLLSRDGLLAPRSVRVLPVAGGAGIGGRF